MHTSAYSPNILSRPTKSMATTTMPVSGGVLAIFLVLLVNGAATNSSTDETCATTAVKWRCENLNGCKWRSKSETCIQDVQSMQMEGTGAAEDAIPMGRSTYCTTNNPAVCDAKIFCQWDYHQAHNRAAISLPTIVHKDAYCAVADTTTQRKLLGESLTVMACASAVAIDPFCDTKFFAREGGVCFCLPKEVACDVQPSIDGPPIELVLKARETISHSFGTNSSPVSD
jgi:hypothetical protein